MKCSTCNYCKSITKTDGLCMHKLIGNGTLVVSKKHENCVGYEKRHK